MSLDQIPTTLKLRPIARLNLEEYELLQNIGEGAYGVVRLARRGKQLLAFKKIAKFDIIKLRQIEHLKNETAILNSISHPFIIRMEGITQDQKFLYIALEYFPGGDFFRFLRSRERLSPTQASFYAAQVTLIFEYLHSLSVVYRDLKPENLLMGSDGYLRLADFGFAKILKGRTYTLCGTPEYLAPEVITRKGHGKGFDWWTLGVLLYEMIAGIDPFHDEDPMSVYQNILEGELRFPRQFDPEARSLVKHLLQHDLGKRFGNLKNGKLNRLRRCQESPILL
jgi:serine/threonine protein kinase